MAERPTRFEHNRWVGDKRTQVVYDLDDPELAERLYISPRSAGVHVSNILA